MLTISGKRGLENKEQRDGYHRVERFHGSFSRSFALTKEVDAEAHRRQVRERRADGTPCPSVPPPSAREIAVKAAA